MPDLLIAGRLERPLILGSTSRYRRELLSRLQLSQAVGDLEINEVQDINRLLTQNAEARLQTGKAP